MFEGLHAIPWAELPHAYGSPEEVPVWLRQLTSDDEQVRQRAMDRLGASLHHQGGIYPATAYAVPYLIALLEKPAMQGKDEILGWLAVFYRASPLDENMWYGEEGAESYGAWGKCLDIFRTKIPMPRSKQAFPSTSDYWTHPS